MSCVAGAVAQCELRSVHARHSGRIMRGGLRWLHRTFQVFCVLTAVLPTATSFRQYGPGRYANRLQIPRRFNLGYRWLLRSGQAVATWSLTPRHRP